MPNGTVKFFNAGKGFGFITSDVGGKEIFVPSASLTASGLSSLKPGQRLSFEELPDKKGPKAVKLVLLSEAARAAVPKERPNSRQLKAGAKLTYYHDHTSEWSSYVLTALGEMGHEPAVVQYLKTPPSKDQLRNLSRLLRENGQSLVRKYDRLFLDLRLDDRFIGDNEFWEAIIEHPTLIDGPLLATEIKAGLFHSDEAIAQFFASAPSGTEQPVAKPKGLSARALQILAGNAVPSTLNVNAAEAAKGEVFEEPAKARSTARAKAANDIATSRTQIKTQSKAKVTYKNSRKAKPKAVAVPKAKSAGLGKAKNSPKNASRKTVKRR
jgi:cold shock CspA family protein/arsenate reductase-like glutaredoxin family protein